MGDRRAFLQRCGQYGTRFAVQKVAELLRDGGTDGARLVSLRVEDGDWLHFDDIVEHRVDEQGRSQTVGWQVKRTRSPGRATLSKLLLDLRRLPDLTRGILGLPSLGTVDGIGDLGALQGICRLAAEPGADHDRLLRRPGRRTQPWIELATAVASGDRRAAVALLARFDLEELGFEREIARATDRHLEATYRRVPPGLKAEIESWLHPLCGMIEITEGLVESEVLTRFFARHPPLFTRTRRSNARLRFLDAEVRLARQERPLEAIADLLPGIRKVALERVRVPATTKTAGAHERTSIDVPWELVTGTEVRVAIIGELGAGKTVTLRELRARLATAARDDGTVPLPLLVHASEIVSGRWRAVVAGRCAINEDELDEILSEPWILLVDGVDEVAHGWERIERAIAGAAVCHGVVAAARPLASPPEPLGYAIVDVQPWNRAQRDVFLSKWEAVDPTTARIVRGRLDQGSLPPMFFANPLTATLCLVLAATGDLASSRSALLAKLASRLFDAWRQKRLSANKKLSWPKLVRALGGLAIDYLRAGGRPRTELEVGTALREAAGLRADALHDEALLQMGGLIVRPDGSYDFALRPLAEYLAAEALVDRSEDDLFELAGEAWALEPARIATSLVTGAPGKERAQRWIRRAANRTLRSWPVFESDFVRPLLVAIRVACDVPAAVEGAEGELLADAVVRVTADESSIWIGDVVARDARYLAYGNTVCWQRVLVGVRPMIRRFVEEPPNWYVAQRGASVEWWLAALYHRENGVRRVAIERLAPYVADRRVRDVLVDEVSDEGVVIGLLSPAIAAGAALRRLTRDRQHASLRALLQYVLANGDQVTSSAAAVALLPTEADLEALVKALRAGAELYVPPNVIEELARSPGGQDALEVHWPGWRDKLASLREASTYAPTAPAAPRTPSHWVRVRVANLCMFALQQLSDDELRSFAWRTQYAGDDSLLEAIDRDPALATRLDLQHVPFEAQWSVGEAASKLPDLRVRLLSAWHDPDFPRALYPGRCLEPLVERNDAAAAAIYAAWLPGSIYAMVVPHSERAPRPAALRHPHVLEATRALALRLIDHTMIGLPDGNRVAPGPTGDMLNNLGEAWRDHPPVFARLREWLATEGRRNFSGVLWALWAMPLPDDLRTTIVDGLRRRLTAIARGEEDVDRWYDAPSWMAWIDEMRLVAELRPEIERLVDTSTRLGFAAGAALLPYLDAGRASVVSAAAAPVGISASKHFLSRGLLRRYVHAAEHAWVDAAVQAIGRGERFDDIYGLRLMEFLGSECRAVVAGALLRSPLARVELPWIAQGGDGFRCARPADLIRKIAFDLDVPSRSGEPRDT